MPLTSNVTTNVKLGVCKVTFGGDNLGFTKGGVEVQVETESHVVSVDQTGSTPISEYITGRTVTIKVPMAETSRDHLVAIMPGATKITDATTPIGDGIYAEVKTGVGTDLRTIAKVLRLHPISLVDTDHTEDFIVPLAQTTGALNFAYKLDEERIFNVEFKAYADNNGKLFYYGNVDINDTTGVIN
jgi:hypothetical protein